MEIPKDDIYNIIIGRTSIIVNRSLLRSFRQQKLDITIEQWSILAILWEKDGCSQHELGLRTFREKAGVTRLIDKLEQQNLIVRVPDRKDRRIRFVYLTARGKSLKEKANEIVTATYIKAIKGIDEEDMAVCKNVLSAIYMNLDADNEYVVS